VQAVSHHACGEATHNAVCCNLPLLPALWFSYRGVLLRTWTLNSLTEWHPVTMRASWNWREPTDPRHPASDAHVPSANPTVALALTKDAVSDVCDTHCTLCHCWRSWFKVSSDFLGPTL